MRPWLHTGPDEAAVLVTVAATEGSCPREAGACMAVTLADAKGTVGGGHLEQEAIRMARDMLRDAGSPRLERFALGPSLGQCCGGVVWLAFDRLHPGERAALCAAGDAALVRLLALDGADKAVVVGGAAVWASTALPLPAPAGQGTCLPEHGGRRWLQHALPAPLAHLFLFGAGHVGAALVQALAPIDCRLTWVDERDDQFPAQRPAHVLVEATDVPEAVVAHAPPGASYLVLTHSHALDLRIVEAILRRGDAAWTGLIGSSTKRRQFERRLRERGIGDASLAALVCPIGLPGIHGKAPAVIAASVTAQLLQAWEARAVHQPHT
jgi:xanthine dehydrogenase accessory factor